jgi:hypothetical protein
MTPALAVIRSIVLTTMAYVRLSRKIWRFSMRITVVHKSYGCDTGCCGHVVEVNGENRGEFNFSHPTIENTPEFVRDMVTKTCGEEHVKDIDWEHCIVSAY